MPVAYRSNIQHIVDKAAGRKPLTRIARPPVLTDAIGKEQTTTKKVPWSKEEILCLRVLLKTGATWENIAKTIGRTVDACKNQASIDRRQARAGAS